MSDEESILYRVVFHQDGKIYELYAEYISEESLVGFLEVDSLIFNDTRSTVVLDPNEEKLRQEFNEVRRTYVPIHLIIRIDEVVKAGITSIKAKNDLSNISHFPSARIRTPPSGEQPE